MRKIASLFTVLMLFSILVLAQTRRVTGRVTGNQGNPVPFATVTETGTTNATQANANGSFSISVRKNARLAVSSAGYQNQTIAANGNTANFTLARGEGQLQEVVVTALSIRRNRNQVPYAAQQLAGEEVKSYSGINIDLFL